MKTNSKLKFTINLVMFSVLMIALSSCIEGHEEPLVETEEIAEIIAGTLAKDSQGMTQQLQSSATASEDAEEGGASEGRQASLCETEYADQFSLTSEENMSLYFNFSFEYFYSFTCNQLMVPTEMEFSMSQSGEVDATRFSSNNTSRGSWLLSGLELTSTQYEFEGDYSRSGQHVSKVGNQNSLDFDLTIDFQDVKMNKGNYVISQGTGLISVSGESSNGASFGVDGTIEFLGNQEMLVTIDDVSYIVNIWTGEVTPV